MSDTAVAKCDFCMKPDPEKVYVVVSVPFGLAGGTRTILTTGEWATCSDCLADLEAGNFEAVFERWLTNVARPPGVTLKQLEAATLAIWDHAWSHHSAVREATVDDRLGMVANLEQFRRDVGGAR